MPEENASSKIILDRGSLSPTGDSSILNQVNHHSYSLHQILLLNLYDKRDGVVPDNLSSFVSGCNQLHFYPINFLMKSGEELTSLKKVKKLKEVLNMSLSVDSLFGPADIVKKMKKCQRLPTDRKEIL